MSDLIEAFRFDFVADPYSRLWGWRRVAGGWEVWSPWLSVMRIPGFGCKIRWGAMTAIVTRSGKPRREWIAYRWCQWVGGSK